MPSPPETAHYYRGRFAPTPSGPLHFGSLVAAMGSYLDARAHQGEWLLRIEDIDPPRVVAGADRAILRTLEAYGFAWDSDIVWQSQRTDLYRHALDQLIATGHVHGCVCSRKILAEHARMGVDGPVYPGTCRGRPARNGEAQRLYVADTRVIFSDALLGRVACDMARECGDFVLKRADGIFTYQLAVVVDDAAQGITQVVRGADLLASTPRQIVLQTALAYPQPGYTHLPVVLDIQGCKLSKQTLAAALDDHNPLPALYAAAQFLGMSPQKMPNTKAFWQWATSAWSLARLPAIRSRRLPVLA